MSREGMAPPPVKLDKEAVENAVTYLQQWMNVPRPRGPATEQALWTVIEFAREYNGKLNR